MSKKTQKPRVTLKIGFVVCFFCFCGSPPPQELHYGSKMMLFINLHGHRLVNPFFNAHRYKVSTHSGL